MIKIMLLNFKALNNHNWVIYPNVVLLYIYERFTLHKTV